jgi:hypothetical protein
VAALHVPDISIDDMPLGGGEGPRMGCGDRPHMEPAPAGMGADEIRHGMQEAGCADSARTLSSCVWMSCIDSNALATSGSSASCPRSSGYTSSPSPFRRLASGSDIPVALSSSGNCLVVRPYVPPHAIRRIEKYCQLCCKLGRRVHAMSLCTCT